MICCLHSGIIHDSKVPADSIRLSEQSFLVCLYKGKDDALDRCSYLVLKLTEQAMKILERSVDGLIRQVVTLLMTPMVS